MDSYGIDGFERRQPTPMRSPMPDSSPSIENLINENYNNHDIETIEISSDDEYDTPPTKKTPDYIEMPLDLLNLKKEKLYSELNNLDANEFQAASDFLDIQMGTNDGETVMENGIPTKNMNAQEINESDLQDILSTDSGRVSGVVNYSSSSEDMDLCLFNGNDTRTDTNQNVGKNTTASVQSEMAQQKCVPLIGKVTPFPQMPQFVQNNSQPSLYQQSNPTMPKSNSRQIFANLNQNSQSFYAPNSKLNQFASNQFATNPVHQSPENGFNHSNDIGNNIPVQTPQTNQINMMRNQNFQNVMQSNQNNPNATNTQMQPPPMQYQNPHLRNPQQPNGSYFRTYNQQAMPFHNSRPYQSPNPQSGQQFNMNYSRDDNELKKSFVNPNIPYTQQPSVNYSNATTNSSMLHRTQYPNQQFQNGQQPNENYLRADNKQAFQRGPLQIPSVQQPQVNYSCGPNPPIQYQSPNHSTDHQTNVNFPHILRDRMSIAMPLIESITHSTVEKSVQSLSNNANAVNTGTENDQQNPNMTQIVQNVINKLCEEFVLIRKLDLNSEKNNDRMNGFDEKKFRRKHQYHKRPTESCHSGSSSEKRFKPQDHHQSAAPSKVMPNLHYSSSSISSLEPSDGEASSLDDIFGPSTSYIPKHRRNKNPEAPNDSNEKKHQTANKIKTGKLLLLLGLLRLFQFVNLHLI